MSSVMGQQPSTEIDQTASSWAAFPIHGDSRGSPGTFQSVPMGRVHLTVWEECWSVRQTCMSLEAVTYKHQEICMSIYKSPLKMSPSCGLKKSRSPPWMKCSLLQCAQWLESAVHTKFCLLLQERYFTEILVVSASIQGCALVISCTSLSLTMYPLVRCQVTRQEMSKYYDFKLFTFYNK